MKFKLEKVKKQNKTKQNKTKQNKTKQNKTKQKQKTKKQQLFDMKFHFFPLSKSSVDPNTCNGKSNSVNNTSPVSSQHGLKHFVWQKNMVLGRPLGKT